MTLVWRGPDGAMRRIEQPTLKHRALVAGLRGVDLVERHPTAAKFSAGLAAGWGVGHVEDGLHSVLTDGARHLPEVGGAISGAHAGVEHIAEAAEATAGGGFAVKRWLERGVTRAPFFAGMAVSLAARAASAIHGI